MHLPLRTFPQTDGLKIEMEFFCGEKNSLPPSPTFHILDDPSSFFFPCYFFPTATIYYYLGENLIEERERGGGIIRRHRVDHEAHLTRVES